MSKTVKLVVPASWFAGGWLPQICAKTGKPTTDTRKTNAEYMSPVAFAGFLMGVVGFLLLHLITRKRVTGVVPLAGGGRRGRNLTLVGFVVMLASFAAMFGLLSPDAGKQMLGALGLLGIFVGLAFVIAGTVAGVPVKLSKDQQWVTFTKAHPDFAAAATAMMAEATAAAAAVPTAPPAMAGAQDPFASSY